MTAERADDVHRAGAARRGRVAADILAERMAATLVHHEPGWRLPRITALARRFNVSAGEVDAAIDELARRHLLRRLPDGQVYRASPVEYHVPMEGMTGLNSHVDPMGGKLVCKSRQVSRRRPPEDIGRSLGLRPGEPVLTVRCLWTVGGEPAALSASYISERLGRALPEFTELPPLDDPEPEKEPGDVTGGLDVPVAAGCGHARALQIEMAPPPPSVARSLRLSVGEPVATLTVSFEDPAAHAPVALTMAMLRPDLFRIVVEATSSSDPADGADGVAAAWTQAVAGWEP